MNQVHNDVGIAVLLKKHVTEHEQIKRCVDQICFYYRIDGRNGQALIFENGALFPERIPYFIRTKIEQHLGRTLFSSPF